MRRDEVFTVGQKVDLDVELDAGSILIRTGPPNTVSVSIDSPTVDSFDVTQIGDRVSIREGRRSRKTRVVVDVPTGSDASIKGASVDVGARGALGALRVRLASGDLDVDDVVRLDATVASGDVRVELVRTDGTFATTSGDIVIRSVGGRLSATVASGDVRVDHVAGDAEVGTASGDVSLRRCDGSSIAVRTLSGTIRLGLPSGIHVDTEISTLSGSVSLPSSPSPAPVAERRPVRVRLRSVSGDIRIERANSSA